jgi:hypothetical protein
MESGFFYLLTPSIIVLINIMFIICLIKHNVLYSLKIIMFAINCCNTCNVRTLTLIDLFVLFCTFHFVPVT